MTTDAWARVRAAVLDADQLVRALASGRRKGQPAPVVEGREVAINLMAAYAAEGAEAADLLYLAH